MIRSATEGAMTQTTPSRSSASSGRSSGTGRQVLLRRVRRRPRRAQVEVRADRRTSTRRCAAPSSTRSARSRAWATSARTRTSARASPTSTGVTVLPWDTRYAVAPADLFLHGEPYSHDSRPVLRAPDGRRRADLGYAPQHGRRARGLRAARERRRRHRPVRRRGHATTRRRAATTSRRRSSPTRSSSRWSST